MSIMPEIKLKLTFFLAISCLIIILMPILIYTFLSMFVFGSGLDTINKSNLIKSIYLFIENTENNFSKQNRCNKINIVTDFEKIPQTFKSILPEHIEDNVLYRAPINSEHDNSKDIYFLISLTDNNKRYFAYQKISNSEAEEYIKPQAVNILFTIISITSIIIIVLFVFTKQFIKKIIKPINTLSEWAKNINQKNVNSPLPDFVYPELFSIANIIQNNLKREYDYIKNEELFWRYCSHELRTPISVIRTGIELLQKKIDSDRFNPVKDNTILNRLRRSTHSMSSIIETILWINRKDSGISKQEIDISMIINDIIQDFKKIYLIENCNLKIIISPHIMIQPDLAIRIVLENLIRNAFQHSMGDEICIFQYKNTVKNN